MDTYEQIPLTIEEYAEAWYSWPQSFTVPRGWSYRMEYTQGYKFVPQEIKIELFCAGDWLEIANKQENKRIRYQIY